MNDERSDVTQILKKIQEGDRSGWDRLLPLILDELNQNARSLLRKERPEHTLQATALVNETWIKINNLNRISWRNSRYFFKVVGETMRQILVDHARGRNAQKRGGGQRPVALDTSLVMPERPEIDLIDLDDALVKLDRLKPEHVELVYFRFFLDLSMPRIAEIMGKKLRTLEHEWSFVRTTLRGLLDQDRS